jgi:hypothetical protein
MKQVLKKSLEPFSRKKLEKGRKKENLTFARITGTDAARQNLERRLY